MSLTPFRENRNLPSVVEWGITLLDPLLDWVFAFHDLLVYYQHCIYYFLSDVAPIIIKYKLRQIGFRGIDNLPFLSWETKQEIKRWLRDYLKKQNNYYVS